MIFLYIGKQATSITQKPVCIRRSYLTHVEDDGEVGWVDEEGIINNLFYRKLKIVTAFVPTALLCSHPIPIFLIANY